MKTVSRKLIFTKLLVIFAALFIFCFGMQRISNRFDKVSASASGPSASHTNAPGETNCTSCHTGNPVNNGKGGITISGLPKNYLPDQQFSVTVTLAHPTAAVFGFQLTAIDNQGRKAGTYQLPAQMPPKMQLIDGLVGGHQRQYIEHTVDGIIPSQFGSHSWTFTWKAPSQRVGKISFYAAGNAGNSDGQTSGDFIYTNSGSVLSGSAVSNFDTDGTSDFAVWRPSTGVWYALNSTNGNFQALQFGSNGDKIAPGDYDGDGQTDLAVFRPSTGVWYVRKSTGGILITQFGTNGDVPVPGDYDGDLKADVAVWRPSTGVWYIFRSSDGGYDIRQFGVSSDKIAQGDYDADGKTDVAVWRPSTGVWYIWKSSDNNFIFTSFGLNGDKPVQGDYDGDGKTDTAVFRPSTGVWYLQRSTAGFAAAQFGISTDKPVPADFDGDGKTDVAVYRNGVWYALKSSDGAAIIASFGLAEDNPVPGGYLAE